MIIIIFYVFPSILITFLHINNCFIDLLLTREPFIFEIIGKAPQLYHSKQPQR